MKPVEKPGSEAKAGPAATAMATTTAAATAMARPARAAHGLGPHERQFCTFFVDDLFLGVPVLKVQEVIRYQEMTRVPLGPPEVQGLINLRGQIVTAIDLRRMLGLPPRDPERKPMNVVVRADDEAMSLLVDEIGDVLDLDPDRFDACPPTSNPAALELILGVCQLPDRLLLLLDVDRVSAAGDATLPARAPHA